MNVFSFFFNSAVVAIEGGNCEMLLSRILSASITPQDLVSTKIGMVFTISARHYKRLRRLRKGTGCRIYVLRKNGLYFKAVRFRKRQSLALCTVLFFLITNLLLGLVWRIDTGTLPLQQSTLIKTMLYSEGVYPGCIANSTELKVAEQNILLKSKQFSFLKLNFIRGRLYVECTPITGTPLIHKSLTPAVASFDGIIKTVEVYEGYSLIKPGQSVVSEQILVDNKILTPKNEYISSEVFARITAYGEDTFTYAEPMSFSSDVITSDTENRYAFRIFSIRIPLYISGITADNTHSRTIVKPVSIAGFKLPLSYEKTEIRLLKTREIALTEEQAAMRAEYFIHQDFLKRYNETYVIRRFVSREITNNMAVVTVKYEFLADIIKKQ